MDLDIFNQHSYGKSKLKIEMRSYVETVEKKIRQMSEDNQQLWCMKAVDKEKRHSKADEESLGHVSEKLRKMMMEDHIVRQRTRRQHEETKEEMDYQEHFFKENIEVIHQATYAKEETKEEMDYQEKFFKENIKVIHQATYAKEDGFEILQQREREKMLSSVNPLNTEEEYSRRAEEIAKSIQLQEKQFEEEFIGERDVLVKLHSDCRRQKSDHIKRIEKIKSVVESPLIIE